MKRLFLLRHAKAEQARKDTPEDRERPLTDRGRKDAPQVGRYMRTKGYVPDIILCSPSTRTRETLKLADPASGAHASVEFPERLYLATARQIMDLLRKLPEDIRRPLVVGHNPGMEECAASLIAESSDPGLRGRFDSLKEKFPTAALAVLDFTFSNWKDLESGSGKLVDFVRPKDLAAP
jgi:phosphohistidine phosphatase